MQDTSVPVFPDADPDPIFSCKFLSWFHISQCNDSSSYPEYGQGSSVDVFVLSNVVKVVVSGILQQELNSYSTPLGQEHEKLNRTFSQTDMLLQQQSPY